MNGVCQTLPDSVFCLIARGPVMASSKVFMKYLVPSKTFWWYPM